MEITPRLQEYVKQRFLISIVIERQECLPSNTLYTRVLKVIYYFLTDTRIPDGRRSRELGHESKRSQSLRLSDLA